eukprot:XP_001705402.1 Hypothetical protein GL50803_39260 [Giardia lamblia ATCC 50803]
MDLIRVSQLPASIGRILKEGRVTGRPIIERAAAVREIVARV